MAADNKTEEATPRRRKKERDKGNISKSQDLNSAVTISAGCALMIFLASSNLLAILSLPFKTENPTCKVTSEVLNIITSIIFKNCPANSQVTSS